MNSNLPSLSRQFFQKEYLLLTIKSCIHSLARSKQPLIEQCISSGFLRREAERNLLRDISVLERAQLLPTQQLVSRIGSRTYCFPGAARAMLCSRFRCSWRWRLISSRSRTSSSSLISLDSFFGLLARPLLLARAALASSRSSDSFPSLKEELSGTLIK